MAMEVEIPYGTQMRRVSVPDGAQVARSKAVAPLQDARAAFDAALTAPIASAPLQDLVRPTDRVALVISDITRPTPNHLLVPWLLESLHMVPREQFVILVGTGSHRAMTTPELVQMLGEEVVARLGNVLWIVDVNRQSLDRVMAGARARQLAETFRAAGWRV